MVIVVNESKKVSSPTAKILEIPDTVFNDVLRRVQQAQAGILPPPTIVEPAPSALTITMLVAFEYKKV